MRSKFQEKILRVLYKALKPLTHLLLEIGIGHREFSEVAKQAYVDVATERYGIRGRKTNISRVAVMTGLTRKEVKRIRDSESTSGETPVKPVPASLVLQHWHMDAEFLDAEGLPRQLEFLGGGASFSGLVKKYAGDIPPGALRTELIRAGAVEQKPNGNLKVLRREFRFVDGEERLYWCFDRCLLGVNLNVSHNFLVKRTGKDAGTTWPNRVSEALRVRKDDANHLREFIRDCSTRYTREIDERITQYENSDSVVGDGRSGEYVDIFAGIYYHETDRK